MMTDANRQFSSGAHSQAVVTVAAGLLILLGILFQLSELGYARLNATNLWLIHMVVENVWTLLAARLNLPALAELLRFWPLLLIAAGFGILALARRAPCLARLSN